MFKKILIYRKLEPVIFFCGIVAGVLLAQMSSVSAETSLFNEYFLNQYALLPVNTERLFFYVGGYRFSQYLVCVCTGFFALAPLLLTGLLFLLGTLWGAMVGISVLELGMKGFIICVAGLFPQIIFYIPAFGWILFWTFYGGTNRKKYVFLALVGLFFLMFGIASEVWLNPQIIRQILYKIS